MHFLMGIALTDAIEESSILEVSPSRTVWALAWPAVALNSLQVVNTLLDRFFIGHLPASALTAQGGAINVMFLMFSLAMALGTSATALVSRAFGAQEPIEVRIASRQNLSLAVLAGLFFAVLTALVAAFSSRAILPVTDPEAIRSMTSFLIVYGLGLPGIYVVQVLAGSLRGVGDTKSPMVISGIQIFLHMSLNCVLIFPTHQFLGFTIPGANMGLDGAAAALAISATVSAVGYLAYAGRTPLGRVWNVRLPTREWTERILKIAFPAALMAVLRVASLTAFTLVLKGVADASVAIAAMSIGFGVESIMFMPSFGLAMAAASLVGQNLGAERPEKAEELGWIASHHGAIVTGCLAAIIFGAAPSIAHTMLDGKPEIVAETVWLIRALCFSEIFLAYAMVTMGAMQGAGDTVRPMWISIGCMWGLRVPLAYILAIGLGYGAAGAWLAMTFSQAIQGVMSIVAFKQGRWKTVKV